MVLVQSYEGKRKNKYFKSVIGTIKAGNGCFSRRLKATLSGLDYNSYEGWLVMLILGTMGKKTTSKGFKSAGTAPLLSNLAFRPQREWGEIGWKMFAPIPICLAIFGVLAQGLSYFFGLCTSLQCEQYWYSPDVGGKED